MTEARYVSDRAVPLVSIIVPTRNAERTLPLCLRSITQQTYNRIEVIVVDNYSRDRTRKIAEDYGAKVYLRGPERSSQKNYGAKMAKGKYLYFIDADFILHPQVVEECVTLARENHDAIIVWNISDPRISIWSKARYYERLSYYGSGLYEAARFVHKDLFWRIGGFDEDLYANEDYDLHLRLLRAGARIARTKRTYELHIGEPRSLKELIAKTRYYSRGLKRYFKKNISTRRALMHAMPFRPTFLRPKFLRLLIKEWPQGLIIIPMMKAIQAVAVLSG